MSSQVSSSPTNSTMGPDLEACVAWAPRSGDKEKGPACSLRKRPSSSPGVSGEEKGTKAGRRHLRARASGVDTPSPWLISRGGGRPACLPFMLPFLDHVGLKELGGDPK